MKDAIIHSSGWFWADELIDLYLITSSPGVATIIKHGLAPCNMAVIQLRYHDSGQEDQFIVMVSSDYISGKPERWEFESLLYDRIVEDERLSIDIYRLRDSDENVLMRGSNIRLFLTKKEVKRYLGPSVKWD